MHAGRLSVCTAVMGSAATGRRTSRPRTWVVSALLLLENNDQLCQCRQPAAHAIRLGDTPQEGAHKLGVISIAAGQLGQQGNVAEAASAAISPMGCKFSWRAAVARLRSAAAAPSKAARPELNSRVAPQHTR